jgi:glycosyltransferase involved in cell wall biosynthesis
MNDRPLVSVCIPTYNRAQKLYRCVMKLLECDYRNIEIIISDNGSTDETAAVCETLRKSDHRVICHRHPSNRGITENFEFSKRQANGKYFLWNADDDYLDADYIRKCVNALDNDANLMCAYGLSAFYTSDNEILHYGEQVEPNSKSSTLRVLTYLWQVADNSIFCGVYRTDPLRNCILPNILAGDWAWIAGVVSLGKVHRVPNTLVHREYGASASSSPGGFKRLIEAQGLPEWQATFPRVVIATGVGNFILRNPGCFSRQAVHQRVLLAGAVVILLLIKGSMSELRHMASMARYIPGVKFLYRRYLKRKS